MDNPVELPLNLAEVKQAMRGLPLTVDVDDLQSVSADLDAQLLNDVSKIMQAGGEWPEALAIQMAITRMYLRKAEHLKQIFESTRH